MERTSSATLATVGHLTTRTPASGRTSVPRARATFSDQTSLVSVTASNEHVGLTSNARCRTVGWAILPVADPGTTHSPVSGTALAAGSPDRCPTRSCDPDELR